MRNAQFLVVDTLPAAVDELCRKFGAWRTAGALLLAVWRRQQTTNQISHLSNRMRRDIGLPEADNGYAVLDLRPFIQASAVRPD